LLFVTTLGSPNAAYQTNVRKANIDVFSPENLQEQLPKTFALMDELYRAGFDQDRAETSLVGKTSTVDS
jgi:hypothetical protein